MTAKGKTKRKPLSRRASRAYGKRNRRLLDLGFKTHAEYTASPLWKSIRERVLANQPVCSVCKQKSATQVHHKQYDPATLRGETLEHLVPICGQCHHTSEVGPKGKKSPAQANGMQDWMRGMLRRQRWEQQNSNLPYSQFRKGR